MQLRGFAGWICRWCRLWKRPLFGVCWISGSAAVWGRDLFPLAFVAFLAFGICGIFSIRHSWHSAHSVPERAPCGTEYAPGAQKPLLWYATRFRKPSVLKTGFYGTGVIFGTGNPLLWYRADIRCAKQASVVRDTFRGHSVLI